jgi:hypothetical protein
MEIHHHPKHSGNDRNYKEYLFEFLVIFVAIVGSFFAENLREHYVERHKEKDYMKSMLQDLKTDTVSLGILIMQNKEQIKGIDSLLSIMRTKMSRNDIKLFYYYDLKYTSNFNGFIPVVRTISQLMNTGGLELVKVKSVADGIVNYNNSVNSVLKQGELLETRFIKSLEQQTEIIDLLSLMKSHNGLSFNKSENYPDLLTTDKKKINTYYFNITIFKGSIYGYNQRLEVLNDQAHSLIKLIQNEYNLIE